jgi:hypothetical protein
MSSRGSSSTKARREQQTAPPPPPLEEDDLLSGSEEGDMGDDLLTGALYTRDGTPLCEAIVYIATYIATLSNNIQATVEKNLRLQKFMAKQLQIISSALTSDPTSEDEQHQDDEEANSTAAQMDAPAQTLSATTPAPSGEASSPPQSDSRPDDVLSK